MPIWMNIFFVVMNFSCAVYLYREYGGKCTPSVHLNLAVVALGILGLILADGGISIDAQPVHLLLVAMLVAIIYALGVDEGENKNG